MGETFEKDLEFDPDEMPPWLSKLTGKKLNPEIIAGINDDDCAVLRISQREIVITTDYLNAKPIALELGFGSYWDLGRILVGANISDLCGTGALPIAFMASIMVEQGPDAATKFKSIMEGIHFQLQKYKIPLIGGDSKLGRDAFCGIAIGVKEKGTKLFLKNAASPGDSIWVSGNIGNVSAAIEGLKKGNMSESWNRWARKSIIEPNVPLKKSRTIASLKIVNGGTDISDGLAANLWNLCKSSNVGAIVDVDAIPTAKQTQQLAKCRDIASWIYSMSIGGDFQFLFTSNSKNDLKLSELGFYRIGLIMEGREAYLNINGEVHPMPKTGHRDKGIISFHDEVQRLHVELLKQLKT
jgi:thiamine-monophosphate kinase